MVDAFEASLPWGTVVLYDYFIMRVMLLYPCKQNLLNSSVCQSIINDFYHCESFDCAKLSKF